MLVSSIKWEKTKLYLYVLNPDSIVFHSVFLMSTKLNAAPERPFNFLEIVHRGN